MSAKLPAVSAKQLTKALEAKGWYLKRIRGSHHYFRHPRIPDAIAVPVHGSRAIRPGVLLHILKTAGISREEFRSLL